VLNGAAPFLGYYYLLAEHYGVRTQRSKLEVLGLQVLFEALVQCLGDSGAMGVWLFLYSKHSLLISHINKINVLPRIRPAIASK
jgi:hypothetical protein